ncbi:cryptochrome DASH [Patiriisocius marinistellae]|uniref:Cryptochrome DASH n=1 Tax=Patiriisocius marinistellae TaxID=2494560 RepID=A0A5J4FWN7_9FLAO|nr:DASH family cryptochrome [Patiriisocius marinistellae]GEQ87117.1 cryptochrome DASH [Patiriisocius marinistellae]
MHHLVWFRNDLRVNNNTSLQKACENAKLVTAIYCFDPRHFKQTSFGFIKTGVFRAQFLIETVEELRKNLTSINIALHVYFEKPEIAIPKLISEEKNITNIFCQREWTSEEVHVLNNLKDEIPNEIRIIETYDQFLFHPEDIPYDDFIEIPKIFTEFRKKCENNCRVRGLGISLKKQNTELVIVNKTKIPNLKKLGFQDFKKDNRTAFPFKGGEKTGMARVKEYIWDSQNIATYKQTRNGLIGVDYSSKFSAWLANGSISARFIYWEIKKFEKEIKKNKDTYWMIFELIWRDFFKYISLKHGDAIFKIDGILKKTYNWHISEEKKLQWINGETRYPFINANMKEIATSGWMSNRGRQNVASFWAKEQAQDWRVGASYFESMLIDYDVHSNWGNWIYNAGVGNDPRDRKFNIERQTNMYDANGAYINLWL